jgi:hypothetical protein
MASASFLLAVRGSGMWLLLSAQHGSARRLKGMTTVIFPCLLYERLFTLFSNLHEVSGLPWLMKPFFEKR